MKNTNLKEKLIKTAVGVDAHIDPHHQNTATTIGADDSVCPHIEGIAIKCRGDFNRPFFEGILKETYGITLVSLVITIVIMLILAGVAISIAIEPNGLFGQAENATEKWNNKVTEEQIEIDKVLGYLGIEPVTEITDQMPEGKGWNSGEEKPVDKVVKQGTRVAPIPKGYTASQIPGENSIQSGLVIYQTAEGQTEVTGEANSDAHKTAMETRNQFVWIPVDDINDMVMCKQNGQAGADGETTCKLVYDVTDDKITCETHGYTTATPLTDANIDTTGLAGRVYGMDTTDSNNDKIWQTSMTFTETSKKEHQFIKDSGYREPDLVTSFDVNDVTTDNDDTNDYMDLAGITSGLAKDLKMQLNNKFIEMAKSVAKYEGFYISRFELGYENNKVISKKNQKVLTAATSAPDTKNYLAGNMWYGLYNKTLNSTEKAESVNSHMIWGCQYDQVINFLGKEKGEIGHNYQTTTQEKTGYDRVDDEENPVVDQDILNNIYDLEGNNYEWTTQAYGTYTRAFRGGGYSSARSGNFTPASYRVNFDYNPTDPNGYYTSRLTLYVK